MTKRLIKFSRVYKKLDAQVKTQNLSLLQRKRLLWMTQDSQ